MITRIHMSDAKSTLITIKHLSFASICKIIYRSEPQNALSDTIHVGHSEKSACVYFRAFSKMQLR